jgi:hypothetical protein
MKKYGGIADRVVTEEILKCVPSRMEQQFEVQRTQTWRNKIFNIIHGLRNMYYEDK